MPELPSCIPLSNVRNGSCTSDATWKCVCRLRISLARKIYAADREETPQLRRWIKYGYGVGDRVNQWNRGDKSAKAAAAEGWKNIKEKGKRIRYNIASILHIDTYINTDWKHPYLKVVLATMEQVTIHFH